MRCLCGISAFCYLEKENTKFAYSDQDGRTSRRWDCKEVQVVVE